jgi:hypothetical protein
LLQKVVEESYAELDSTHLEEKVATEPEKGERPTVREKKGDDKGKKRESRSSSAESGQLDSSSPAKRGILQESPARVIADLPAAASSPMQGIVKECSLSPEVLRPEREEIQQSSPKPMSGVEMTGSSSLPKGELDLPVHGESKESSSIPSLEPATIYPPGKSLAAQIPSLSSHHIVNVVSFNPTTQLYTVKHEEVNYDLPRSSLFDYLSNDTAPTDLDQEVYALWREKPRAVDAGSVFWKASVVVMVEKKAGMGIRVRFEEGGAVRVVGMDECFVIDS